MVGKKVSSTPTHTVRVIPRPGYESYRARATSYTAPGVTTTCGQDNVWGRLRRLEPALMVRVTPQAPSGQGITLAAGVTRGDGERSSRRHIRYELYRRPPDFAQSRLELYSARCNDYTWGRRKRRNGLGQTTFGCGVRYTPIGPTRTRVE